MYITFFSFYLMPIHIAQKTQIALLVVEKIKISTKYSDFLNVFLEKKALVLSKATMSNQYTIKLQKNQQPSYKQIYSLSLVKLKMLKLISKSTLPTTLFNFQSYLLVFLSFFIKS